MYNTKNYTEQGGDKTVIGGILEIKEDAILLGFPQAENQAASTETTNPTVAEFNALINKLKAAGLMLSDE